MSRSAILAALAEMMSNDSNEHILLNQSPAQFDNTLKLVTSAFVQRALGNFSAVQWVPSGGTLALSATSMGNAIGLTGTGTTNITLPLISSILLGSCVMIVPSAGTTITPSGSDLIYNTTGASAASLVPASGCPIRIVAVTPGVWVWLSEGAGISSLVSSGYMKFPNKLIIQWGFTGASVVGGSTVTFPITFPTGLILVCLGGPTSSAVFNTMPNTTANASGFPFEMWNTSGASVSGIGSNYIAIGT